MTSKQAGIEYVYGLGVDPNLTSTGVAVVRCVAIPNSGIEYVGSETVEGSTDGLDRHMLMCNEVINQLIDGIALDARHIVSLIELPYIGGNKHISIRLGYIHGSCRMALLSRLGLGNVLCWGAKRWRKGLWPTEGGKLTRAAAKAKAMMECNKQWGVDLNDDEAEATMMAAASLLTWQYARKEFTSQGVGKQVMV